MKILIVGNVGSGKTTLAKRLSNFFDIPYFSIDSIVHDDNNNGIKRSEDEQVNIINNINRNNKDYILEGVVRDNLFFIFNLFDKIIFLDYSLKKTLKRVKIRYLKQKLKLEKCDYVCNREMYKNMIKWNNEFDRDKLIKKLNKYSNKLLIIRNNRELKVYYKYLEKNKYNL